jgi:hypothetical protein
MEIDPVKISSHDKVVLVLGAGASFIYVHNRR